MVDYKVLAGVTTLEYARRADFYDYYNRLILPEGSFKLPSHNRSPARGRNLIIDAARELNMTHVLLIDDDMQFEPEAAMKLLVHDKDIVTGLYLSRAYPHAPLAFDLIDDEGAAFPMYLTPDKTGLVPIKAAGLGFCLIKLSVFDLLKKPYIRLGELNPEEWCDDIGFFNRVRDTGVEIFCDLDVQIGHIGTMIIRPNFQAGVWNSMYDTSGEGGINVPQFHPKVEYKFKEK